MALIDARSVHIYKVFHPRSGAFLGAWRRISSELRFPMRVNSLASAVDLTFAHKDIQLAFESFNVTDEAGNLITDEAGNFVLGNQAKRPFIGEGGLLDNDYLVEIEYATTETTHSRQSFLITNSGKRIITNSDKDILVDNLYGKKVSKQHEVVKPVFNGYVSRRGQDVKGSAVYASLRSHSARLAGEKLLNLGAKIINLSIDSDDENAKISVSGDVRGVLQRFNLSQTANLASIEFWLQAISKQSVSIFCGISSQIPTDFDDHDYLAQVNRIVDVSDMPYIQSINFGSNVELQAGTYYLILIFSAVKLDLRLFTHNAVVYGNNAKTITDDATTSLNKELSVVIRGKSYNTQVVFNNVKPSNIVKSLLDYAISQNININYTNDSIDDMPDGSEVNHIFKNVSIANALKKCQEAAGGDYYFYVDYGTNTFYFKKRKNTPKYLTNNLCLKAGGSFYKTSETLIKEVYFTGGKPTDDAQPIFIVEKSDNFVPNGKFVDLADEEVKDVATARKIAAGYLVGKDTPIWSGNVTFIKNDVFNIHDLRPGDRLMILATSNDLDDKLIYIASVNYGADSVSCQLGYDVADPTQAVKNNKESIAQSQIKDSDGIAD